MNSVLLLTIIALINIVSLPAFANETTDLGVFPIPVEPNESEVEGFVWVNNDISYPLSPELLAAVEAAEATENQRDSNSTQHSNEGQLDRMNLAHETKKYVSDLIIQVKNNVYSVLYLSGMSPEEALLTGSARLVKIPNPTLQPDF